MIKVINHRFAVNSDQNNTVRVYIGRPSPLGNPFVIGKHGTREEVLGKYKRWLATTDAALKELLRIKELAQAFDVVELECWCAPLPCHGDIIKQVVEEWKG